MDYFTLYYKFEDYSTGKRYEYEYEVSEAKICAKWLSLYGKKGNGLEGNCKLVIEQLTDIDDKAEIYKRLKVKTIEEAIEKAKKEIARFNKSAYAKEHSINKIISGYTILDEVLGDIGYYFDKYQEELKEQLEDEAYEEFKENL